MLKVSFRKDFKSSSFKIFIYPDSSERLLVHLEKNILNSMSHIFCNEKSNCLTSSSVKQALGLQLPVGCETHQNKEGSNIHDNL